MHCVNTVFMKPKFWHLLGNFILLVPCLLFLSWCFFYQQCFMFQIWRTNQLWPRHCLTSFYLSPWTSMIEDKSDLSPSHQACVKGQGQRLWWSARGCVEPVSGAWVCERSTWLPWQPSTRCVAVPTSVPVTPHPPYHPYRRTWNLTHITCKSLLVS